MCCHNELLDYEKYCKWFNFPKSLCRKINICFVLQAKHAILKLFSGKFNVQTTCRCQKHSFYSSVKILFLQCSDIYQSHFEFQFLHHFLQGKKVVRSQIVILFYFFIVLVYFYSNKQGVQWCKCNFKVASLVQSVGES